LAPLNLTRYCLVLAGRVNEVSKLAVSARLVMVGVSAPLAVVVTAAEPTGEKVDTVNPPS
jgi:hypothetical protein